MRNNKYFSGIAYGCIPLLLPIFADGAVTSSPEEIFYRIIEARNDYNEAINSIELEYTYFKRIGPENKPKSQYAQHVKYGRMNNKQYWLSSNNDGNNEGRFTIKFDGEKGRSRTSLMPGIVGQSRDMSRIKYSGPLPGQLAEIVKQQKLVEMLEVGKANIRSAEKFSSHNRNIIKLTFTINDENKDLILENYYDVDHGYWPVQTKLLNKNEQLLQEASITLETVEFEGNKYYYPAKGRNVILDGELTKEFKVNKESLRINQEIPHSKFVLQVQVDEELYDGDLHMILKRAGENPAVPELPEAISEINGKLDGKSNHNETNADEFPSTPKLESPSHEKSQNTRKGMINAQQSILIIVAIAFFVLGISFWFKRAKKQQ